MRAASLLMLALLAMAGAGTACGMGAPAVSRVGADPDVCIPTTNADGTPGDCEIETRPTVPPAGVDLQITGSGFTDGARVDFNGHLVDAVVADPGHLTAHLEREWIPTGGESANGFGLAVVNPGGERADRGLVFRNADPKIARVTPDRLDAGGPAARIVLEGDDLVGGRLVPAGFDIHADEFNYPPDAVEVQVESLHRAAAVIPAAWIAAPGTVRIKMYALGHHFGFPTSQPFALTVLAPQAPPASPAPAGSSSPAPVVPAPVQAAAVAAAAPPVVTATAPPAVAPPPAVPGLALARTALRPGRVRTSVNCPVDACLARVRVRLRLGGRVGATVASGLMRLRRGPRVVVVRVPAGGLRRLAAARGARRAALVVQATVLAPAGVVAATAVVPIGPRALRALGVGQG